MKDKNRIVRKNNLAISSRISGLSLIQTKLLNLAISELTEDNKPGDILRFNAIDVLKIIGLGEDNFTELRKSTLSMIRGVELFSPDGAISQVPIFHGIKYHPGGLIEIRFHDDVLPFLIKAKIEFTKYYFENIQRLKSTYSIRIYELCKQYQNTFNGYREFTLDDLKYFLDMSKKIYPRYVDFKRRVITPSIEEINEKTDLFLKLEEVKIGRSVNKLRFYITPKNETNVDQESSQLPISEEMEQLTRAGLKLVEDYIMSKSVAIELQILAQSDDCLFYAMKEFNKKLDYQIKQGNKPSNLPRYTETALREMIPTILISGVVEKEKTIQNEQKLKQEAQEKANKEKLEKEAKAKEDSKKAWAEFEAMPEDEKAILIGKLLSNEGEIVRNQYKKNGLQSMMIKTKITTFIKHSWAT